MSTQYEVAQLSDSELLARLRLYGFNPGPVTSTTRSTFEKKLVKYYKENPAKMAGTRTSNTSLNDSGVAVLTSHGVHDLTDDELIGFLNENHIPHGPITDSTRATYQKKVNLKFT